jgi:hypothetical protein
MKKNEINGQNSVATSAQEEKGYIQITTKNNGKLLDYTQRKYKSTQQLNIDYCEFVNYYTKQYMMHTSDDNINISFGEGAFELNFANDVMAYTSRKHKARKMYYSVGGYSVEIYKVVFVED